jgi:hypothetical protein
MQQIRGDNQCLDGVFNSYRHRCLDIIKVFDMFSIKHIPWEENNRANRLAQQAAGYVVSQGVFWVASVTLVEQRNALGSKGKPVLQDKEKPIPGNAKRLPGNMDQLRAKTELELGRTESELGKTELSSSKEKPVLGNVNQLLGNIDRLSRKADPGTEPGSGKAELRLSYECGLWKELVPISRKEDNEESVTKKSESEKDGSPVDE